MRTNALVVAVAVAAAVGAAAVPLPDRPSPPAAARPVQKAPTDAVLVVRNASAEDTPPMTNNGVVVVPAPTQAPSSGHGPGLKNPPIVDPSGADFDFHRAVKKEAHYLLPDPPPASAGEIGEERAFAGGGVTNQTGGGCCALGVSDGAIAVGSTYFVQAANGRYGWGLKSSVSVSTIDNWGNLFAGYPGVPAGDNVCIDVKAVYTTNGGGRFIIGCQRTDGAANYYFAVSKTGNPSDGWYKYFIPSSVDRNDLVVTSDKLIMSRLLNGNSYFSVMNLATLLAGPGSNSTSPTVQAIGPVNIGVARGAEAMGPAMLTEPAAYYVRKDDPYNIQTFSYYTISGSAGSASLSGQSQIGTDPNIQGTQNTQVPGGFLISLGRTQTVITRATVYKNAAGHKILAFSGQTGCGIDPSRMCAYADKFDTTTPNFVVQTYLATGGSIISPSIVTDGSGTLFVAYSYASPTQLPVSALLTNTFSVITHGATSSSLTENEAWGDYFGAAMDPAAVGNIFAEASWQNGSTGTSWATEIVRANSSGSF